MSKVNWTKEQLQAIEENRNNVLVAAAAGSGKTAVLVERMIHKIVDEKVDIDKILIVTFTNAAASEMRERILEAIYQKIEENPQETRLQRQITLLSKASICTIDSFCLDVVRNHFYEIGVSPNFKIADTTEIELLKLETLEDLFEEKYEEKNKNFLDLLETYTTYLSDEALKNLILNIHTFIQSSPFPREWLEEKVEEFNMSEQLEIDFSLTKWGKLIIDEMKDQVLDCKLKLNKLYQDLLKFDELQKYAGVILSDINNIDTILKLEKWDEIYHAILSVNFEKWPTNRKITLEAKEIAKTKRDMIKKQFNKAVEIFNCSSKEANQDIVTMYPILKNIKNLVFEFEDHFAKNKKEKNIADFNDIEHFALNILLKKEEKGKYIPSDVALKYKKKFEEIAIDEYQDSNLVQEYILTSISNGHNLFMVGDVKQSIYQFRQACPDLFLNKYEQYQEQAEEKAKGIKIQLFKNFRSRKNILDTTNLVFQTIMSKELGDIDYNQNEYLNLGADFGEQQENILAKNTQICIIENKTEVEEELEEPVENIVLEAKYVARKIKEIVGSEKLVYDKKQGYRPVTYKDIVILLRATKQRANLFEKEISNLGMPVFSDTSAEYLESIEIQTMMSLLKIIDNPMQDIPLVTVLKSAIFGFTDNELIEIRVVTGTNKTFYESMKEFLNTQNIQLIEKIQKFFDRLNKWQQEKEYLDLDELIWKIYMDTGYYQYVSLMPNGILRQANLKSLFEKARQYEKASFKGLYNFINFIDKLKSSSGDLSAAKLIGENENVIRIMSIHKSKGLEFPIVFLCGANKQFNMQDLNAPILLHQKLGIGVDYIDKERKIQYSTLTKEAIKKASREELLSEEMRILYVALTRAKEQLLITGVSKDVEADLKEKEEALTLYKENKINKNILKKYKSYLDWIELVYLKNKESELLGLNMIAKNEITESDTHIVSDEEQERDIDDLKLELNKISREELESLKQTLEWKYENIEASKIESKTSVSKIKSKMLGGEERVQLIKTPNFLKEEKSLTGAEKGTVIHLCMQNLVPGQEYNTESIRKLIENLRRQNKITELEYNSIDIRKIENFTKSFIWQELKIAKTVEQEKTFYINIAADEIYHNGVQEDILVQGIIDLYYINEKDELILVDYKTDFVQTEEELIEKYKIQLQIYQKALEQVYQRRVDKIYIYSTYLNKPVGVRP